MPDQELAELDSSVLIGEGEKALGIREAGVRRFQFLIARICPVGITNDFDGDVVAFLRIGFDVDGDHPLSWKCPPRAESKACPQ